MDTRNRVARAIVVVCAASTMVAAAMGLAKLHGLIVKNRKDVPRFERPRSSAEIEAEIVSLLEDAGLRVSRVDPSS